MRVLMMSLTLGRGGAEQSIVNTLPALLARGVDVEVASLSPPYDLAESIEAMGVRVHRHKIRHVWDLAGNIGYIVALARRGGYDVLQCYDYFDSSYAALARPLLGRVRVIASFQGLEFDRDDPTTPWRKLRRRLRIQLLRHGIDRGVAVSDAARRHYERHTGRRDLLVIENPFPPRILEWSAHAPRAELERRFGVAPDEIVAVMVGRFISAKAHTVMVDAVQRVHAQKRRLRVLCFGEGPLREEIAARVEQAGLQGRIELHAPLRHEELFPLVRAADLYLQPSRTEGFSLAIGEAMALGKAVLSTSVGGTVELIEDGVSGILVPPDDVDALAGQLVRLMDDAPLRQRLGDAARARVQSKFSAEQIADKWVALYAQLTGSLESRAR